MLQLRFHCRFTAQMDCAIHHKGEKDSTNGLLWVWTMLFDPPSLKKIDIDGASQPMTASL
jgi:hypothetical protein